MTRACILGHRILASVFSICLLLVTADSALAAKPAASIPVDKLIQPAEVAAMLKNDAGRTQTTWRANGLQVISVSMDDNSDDVRAFLTAHPVTFPVVMGDAQLAESFGGVLGLPLSYLIDRQGRVIARYQGETSLKTMEAKVRGLLGVPARVAEKRSR